MALKNETVTELFVLSIGDGAGPEVFTPICSFADGSRTFEYINNFVERKTADCSAVTGPLKIKRAIDSQDWSFDIEGSVNAGDDKTLLDWAKLATAKSIKIVNTLTGGITVSGSAFLANVRVAGGGKGQPITVSARLVANGDVTITATS